MFKAPTLPPAKKVSMSVLVYKQKKQFADVLQNGCSWKYCKLHKKSPARGFFFYKIAVLLFAVCKFIKKETLAQLSSCEFCETFKKAFHIEHCCFYRPIKLILDLSNLTIEYKLRVVSYSWESESRVNAN